MTDQDHPSAKGNGDDEGVPVTQPEEPENNINDEAQPEETASLGTTKCNDDITYSKSF